MECTKNINIIYIKFEQSQIYILIIVSDLTYNIFEIILFIIENYDLFNQ